MTDFCFCIVNKHQLVKTHKIFKKKRSNWMNRWNDWIRIEVNKTIIMVEIVLLYSVRLISISIIKLSSIYPFIFNITEFTLNEHFSYFHWFRWAIVQRCELVKVYQIWAIRQTWTERVCQVAFHNKVNHKLSHLIHFINTNLWLVSW